MRKKMVERLAEQIVGTTGGPTLDEAIKDFDHEEKALFNELVFNCETCNWWRSSEERNGFFGEICDDCATEEDQ